MKTKKALPLIAFSVLLLVPVGTQQVFANHPSIPTCTPPGELITTGVITPLSSSIPFCVHSIRLPGQPSPSCLAPYSQEFLQIATVNVIGCTVSPTTTQDPTHPDQCQNGAILVGNHCFPDLEFLCSGGSMIENGLCVCQQLGSMIGGAILDINTVPLLVGAIGTNPIITALMAITLAGIVGQTVWFLNKRQKKNIEA